MIYQITMRGDINVNQVKISTHDGVTEIILNGASVSNMCTGYSLKQDGGESPVLTLELVCDDIDILGDGVTVKQ